MYYYLVLREIRLESSQIRTMVNFHFSPESPDEEYFSNVQTLNALPEETFKEVVDLCFDHLSAERTEELNASVVALARKAGMKATVFQPSFVSLLVFVNGCTRYNLTAEQVKDDLGELGLEGEKSAVVLEAWGARSDDLYDAAVDQTLRVNELVDMEWSFGVASSTNEVKKVGSAFLRVKFVFDKGGKTETVHMEMSLPQFYEFLHEMEKARAGLTTNNGASGSS